MTNFAFLPGPPLPETRDHMQPTMICLDCIVLWKTDVTCWMCGRPGENFGYDLISALRWSDAELRRKVLAAKRFKLVPQEVLPTGFV